jgi:hypothetical protein
MTMPSNNAQTPNSRTDLVAFFNDVLPPPADGQVFVAGALPKPTGSGHKSPMHHAYVATHEQLADQVLNPSNATKENYFALARFCPHQTANGYPGRQGDLATSAKSFWLDLDCGQDKAGKGEGYLTQQKALAALAEFADDWEFPTPTYVVNSGGGLHVYWCLAQEIPATEWRPVAARLKALTERHKLRADPTRTADIASVLRPPGTQNHKLANPRPVAIISPGDLVSFDVVKAAIESALARPLDNAPPPNDLESNLPASSLGPPDLAKLKSALASLSPDCVEKDWKFRVAALAREAKRHPALHDELRELARNWSRGDLCK